MERDANLRLYLQGSHRPRSHIPYRAGRWIGVRRPPDARSLWDVRQRILGAEGRLPVSVQSPLTTGICSGQWCAYGMGSVEPDLPLNQRLDDSGSACFDFDLPSGETVVAGNAVVVLSIETNRPEDTVICVRLCEVDNETGDSERLSFGIFHINRENSLGENGELKIRMKPFAHVLCPRNKLRIAISTSYWPMIW